MPTWLRCIVALHALTYQVLFSLHFAADLREGILDPFPLLLEEETPSTHKRRARLVNPLLLVTERKGKASSLHYGAFPLDAFNTDGMHFCIKNQR